MASPLAAWVTVGRHAPYQLPPPRLDACLSHGRHHGLAAFVGLRPFPAVETPPSVELRPFNSRKLLINTTFQAGKYLVSPLIKPLPDGRYAASVSIRSGLGSATHDRVLRLARTFDNPQAAQRYAADHGMAWVGAKSRSRYTPTEI